MDGEKDGVKWGVKKNLYKLISNPRDVKSIKILKLVTGLCPNSRILLEIKKFFFYFHNMKKKSKSLNQLQILL
jgi:hypothetical protein